MYYGFHFNINNRDVPIVIENRKFRLIKLLLSGLRYFYTSKPEIIIFKKPYYYAHFFLYVTNSQYYLACNNVYKC